MNTFTLWACRYIWTHIQNTYLKNLELVDEFSNNTKWLICTWQHVGTWYFSSKGLTVTCSLHIVSWIQHMFLSCATIYRKATLPVWVGSKLVCAPFRGAQAAATGFCSRKEAFEAILSGGCLHTHSLRSSSQECVCTPTPWVPSAVTCPWPGGWEDTQLQLLLLASWRQLFS